MKNPACVDPEKIIPISRSTTMVFKTGTWGSRRPEHQEKVSPCRVSCPAGNNIPMALFHAARADFNSALQVFLEENPLPGVCGRVCYHLCEGVCNRIEWDGAVNIRALERAASDLGHALPQRLTEKGAPYPIAVVGSGPAGLSSAYHLARMGHPVTMLESEEEIGGLLRWGIPEYRLPGEVLERDLTRILSLGIRVVKGARAEGAALEDLARRHKAVFLAPGAQKARDLGIPGVDLQGVVAGVEFLRLIRRGNLPGISGRAVVIGGGNVAIDSALSARRMGADKVTLISLEKREEMPAHERERQDALEEGIEFLNGWGPVAFIGKKGRVAGVRLSRCVSLFDAEGNFRPVYDQAGKMSLDADLVVSSIGQTPDPSFLKESQDFAPLACEGPLRVDGSTLRTAISNVFAGGDVVRFPGSVAEAIGAGKRAAIAIHLSTTGEPLGDMEKRIAMGGGTSLSIQALFNRRSGWDPTSVVKFQNLEALFLQHRERHPENRLRAEERGRGFDEITLGFDPHEAQSEAERCFSCGTCTGCDRCYNFCPEVSLLPPGGERQSYEADPDYCKGCAVCASVCPSGVMSMGKER